MPELSRGDSRPPVYPTRRESQMPEPMVDILICDYYHPELAKKPSTVLENGMTAAFDGWPFSSKGPVKLETDNRTLDKSGASASAKVSYPWNHILVYPLGLSQPIAPPTCKSSSPSYNSPCQETTVL
jgi:hypothetical protein